MKDFTAKKQIFLLDIMIGNLWLFLDRTSLLFTPLSKLEFIWYYLTSSLFNFKSKWPENQRSFKNRFWIEWLASLCSKMFKNVVWTGITCLLGLFIKIIGSIGLFSPKWIFKAPLIFRPFWFEIEKSRSQVISKKF